MFKYIKDLLGSKPIEPVNKPINPNSVVVLVPVAHHIEPEVDASFREMEKRGITVVRQWGFSAIEQGRSMMVNKAMEDGYEWIIFIDADTVCWSYDVEKLISHNLDIVGGVYTVKGWPNLTTEFMYNGSYILGEGGGLHEVKYMATGFMCVNRRVYEKLKETAPKAWFWGNTVEAYHYYLPCIIEENGRKSVLGEDYSFSKYCRDAGFKIWADTTIKLGHIGRYPYSFDFIKRGKVPEPESVVYYQNK